jgi:hypothetical protein
LWRATGDLERSTRWTAWSAEAIGWFAIVLGVPIVLATRDMGMLVGMWITIGGFYLASAGAQAYGVGFGSESPVKA